MKLAALTSHDLGRRGEWRAAMFYRMRGFRIVGRNVRWRGGEIDLIARRGRLVVFVEVKTRRANDYGEPWEAVSDEKQHRMAELARRWCAEQRVDDVQIRFDVMSLLWRGWYFQLKHFPSAFELVADARWPWLDAGARRKRS